MKKKNRLRKLRRVERNKHGDLRILKNFLNSFFWIHTWLVQHLARKQPSQLFTTVFHHTRPSKSVKEKCWILRGWRNRMETFSITWRKWLNSVRNGFSRKGKSQGTFTSHTFRKSWWNWKSRKPLSIGHFECFSQTFTIKKLSFTLPNLHYRTFSPTHPRIIWTVF